MGRPGKRRKLLTNRQGLGVGRLRFLQPCGVEEEQVAQVVVNPGQGLPELGPAGELGRELLQDRHGLEVGRLRLLQPPGVVVEQLPKGIVGQGQFLAVLGLCGELVGELL